MKHGISQPIFNGNVVNKARKCIRHPNGRIIHLYNLIRKGYRHNIIIKSLNMVFIGTNIDFLDNSLIRNLTFYIFIKFSTFCIYIFRGIFTTHVFI